MKLTLVERAILANQYKILALLEPDNAEYYDERQETFRSPYESHYAHALEVISDENHTTEECEEVNDILQMFRVIGQTLGDRQLVEVDETLRFDGFDGNHEWEYHYVEFLVNTLSVWEELKAISRNSHGPRRSRYRSMRNAWKACVDPYDPSDDDLRRIAKSASPRG